MDVFDEIFDTCWRFIRGDMETRKFEKWIYETSELQSFFSENMYLTLLSTNYVSSGAVFLLKRELKEALDSLFERNCDCHTLSNTATLGMGTHNNFFKSLEQSAKYGAPLWWLRLSQCKMCEEFWMIGSEERINDVFVLKRLSVRASLQIINKSLWPDDFKTFEALLRIAKEHGHSVRFFDPMSPALVSTVVDLARARPGIGMSDISKLLQISSEQAKAVIAEASKKPFVRITN